MAHQNGKPPQKFVPISKPVEIKSEAAFHKEVDRAVRIFDRAAKNEARRREGELRT